MVQQALSPTADPDAPLAPDPQSLAAPPEREPALRQEERAPEATGEYDTEDEPQAPAWASLATADEVLELEEFKGRVEQRETDAFERGRTETYNKLQPFQRRQEAQYQQVVEGIGELSTALKRAQRDGGITPEQLSDLLDDHKRTFQALQGLDREAGFWEGVGGFLGKLAGAAQDLEIATRFGNRILEYRAADKQYGDPDPQLWADIYKALAASARKPVEAKLEEAEAKITRLEAEMAQQKRDGKPPPTGVTGGSGIKRLPTKEQFKRMSREEVMAIPREDRDRIIAGS